MTPREALEKVRPLLEYTHLDEDVVSKILAEVDAILEEPPRNCDYIRDYSEFVKAWNHHVYKAERNTTERFLAWLACPVSANEIEAK